MKQDVATDEAAVGDGQSVQLTATEAKEETAAMASRGPMSQLSILGSRNQIRLESQGQQWQGCRKPLRMSLMLRVVKQG